LLDLPRLPLSGALLKSICDQETLAGGDIERLIGDVGSLDSHCWW
jgi:hypothetical protein